MTGATGFWPTVGLLLRFAHRRSRARAEHQKRLRGHTGTRTMGAGLAILLGIVMGGFVHGMAALLLSRSVDLSPRASVEAEGRKLVSPECFDALVRAEAEKEIDVLRGCAREDPRVHGRDEREGYAQQLLAHYRRYGRAGMARTIDPWSLVRAGRNPLAALLGTLVIGIWFVMLAFQGEGADLDLQRRRHPMWEWLLGHPVDPRAVFLAEMLAPLSANLFFTLSPIFWIGAFWTAYDDLATGLLAGLAAGLPIAVAASCLSKAIEIVALLRLAPRSRGATLGILSWLGYTAYIALFFAAFSPSVILTIADWLAPFSGAPHPPIFAWALGLHETPSAWQGVVACWGAAGALIAAAVHVSARATQQGLAGGFGEAPSAPRALAEAQSPWLRRDPLYRKELLWLWRDRGALIQVFLIPMTVAAFQLFNFRHLLTEAPRAWHLMAGASVIFGSYFLWILGPRSLLSEGSALWIPLTWPRGLEDLLRAKARLWWLISCIVVGPLLLITALRFPADAAKIALVGLAWIAFGGSLASKAVTLVSAPRPSGELEPVPKGRQWAAGLGLFTFGAGILSQQWSLAFVGIVYSWMTSAALWQNFRARLPYLFDPWSERPPTPPTLMHGMIAISVMMEIAAVAFGFSSQATTNLVAARTVSYGVAAVITGFAVDRWLSARGVERQALWRWDDSARGPLWASSAVGLALGLLLGGLGALYSLGLQQLEWGESFYIFSEQLARRPWDRLWLALLTVGLAPVAEEYLFRGLLFRALDREWGGARAIWGSACFFAIYHAPQAWIPVVLVGAANAWLFKRTGRLAPCVVLHMAYNAVIVWTT